MEAKRKPVIGLTGQIGAGKTLVASILRELGCGVIEADVLARQILEEPAGVDFVRRTFGPRCLTPEGHVNRTALADIVFQDPAKKQQLEAHIYPILHERRRELAQRYQADPAVKAVVLEAPLLFENALQMECDWVILVLAEWNIRQARVGKSRSWGPEELIRREKFFLPVHLKRALADVIITNNSTVDDCRRQVENIFSRLISSEKCKLA